MKSAKSWGMIYVEEGTHSVRESFSVSVQMTHKAKLYVPCISFKCGRSRLHWLSLGTKNTVLSEDWGLLVLNGMLN